MSDSLHVFLLRRVKSLSSDATREEISAIQSFRDFPGKIRMKARLEFYFTVERSKRETSQRDAVSGSSSETIKAPTETL